MFSSTIRFREGMKVRNRSYSAGVPVGTEGTVATVAGFRGKSIYCDPSRIMVFVQWANGQSFGVFKGELERA